MLYRCELPAVCHTLQLRIPVIRLVVPAFIMYCHTSYYPAAHLNLLYGILSRWVLYMIFANLSRCVLPDNNICHVFQVCIRCSTLCCPGLYYRKEALAAMTKWHRYTCVRFVPWVKEETRQKYGLPKESHVTITKGRGWESTRNKKPATWKFYFSSHSVGRCCQCRAN